MESRAHVGIEKMKEEDFLDANEPAVSATLSKEGKTVMRKLVKAKAPMCSIYNLEFIILMEEHELGFEENLTRIVD